MSDKDDPVIVNINTNPKPPSFVNQVVSTISRAFNGGFFGVSKNGARDINKVYGYNVNPDFENFYWMYRRFGIATRVVNSVARSCWRDGITILRDEQIVLEDEIKILNKKGKMTRAMEQADILNRIGNFSVLFVGVPDGLDPSEPLGTANPNFLSDVYFKAYAEDGIQITAWETDVASPRYGEPLLYQLQVQNRGDSNEIVLTNPIIVHWSRVVHLAEGSLDSNVEGLSSLECILNTLEDMVKTSGGGAEAYYRNARNRFSMETDPAFAASFSDADKIKLEDEALKFQNEWQDFIRAGGIQIKSLNVPFHDPEETFRVLVLIVSGATGIPVRILLGEGAGQLAGNEDKDSYNQLVQDRRDLWCSEWMNRVFEMLASAGMFNYLEDDEISWTVPEAVSPKEKSLIASANAAALNQMSSALSTPALDGVISVVDAMQLIFGVEETAEMTFDETGNDGLDDETVTDNDIAAARSGNVEPDGVETQNV